jgi:hypothetical protein
MQCGNAWDWNAPAQRKVKVIGMKVNNIELLRLAENLFNHQGMVGQRIDAIRIESQRFFTGGNQACIGHRVPAGKQGDVVSE